MGDDLLQAVHLASLSKKTGARVTLDAATGEVLVHDCPVWSQDNFTLLRLLCPSAEVSVHSSTSSLSGFMLAVRRPPPVAVAAHALLAAGSLALLYLFGRDAVLRATAALCAACAAPS